MIKFSITKLEEARSNTRQFADSLIQESNKKSIMGRSKYRTWQYATRKYHKLESEQGAINILENSLSNFKTIKRKEIDFYIDRLQHYIENHRYKRFSYVGFIKSLSITIYPEVIVSGEIPIINLTPQGYGIFLFSKKSYPWQNELRFPLIQHHFANVVYGCDSSEIEVGIYCFETDSYESKIFVEAEIENALAETNEMGRIINETSNRSHDN